jgi:hypothetical protein
MVPSIKKASAQTKKGGKKPALELPKQVETKSLGKKTILKKNKSITRQQLEQPKVAPSPPMDKNSQMPR